jgi:hypothetical protein
VLVSVGGGNGRGRRGVRRPGPLDRRHVRRAFLPGSRRALGTYRVPDGTPILDLDDAEALLDRGLRPTQVIERNRPATQAWALSIFNERASDGGRRWNGVRWWSYHRPQWRIYGLWEITPDGVAIEALDLAHPAVQDAARTLARPVVRPQQARRAGRP